MVSQSLLTLAAATTKEVCSTQPHFVLYSHSSLLGRAIDTSYYDYWRPTLEKFGWRWYGNNDRVHFDYLAAQDLARENLRAFQHLHNQHSSNKIDEDGIYGPATAKAFYDAPCGGW